jgi:predicted DNA-binding protein (MmcQ/YjbR family)
MTADELHGLCLAFPGAWEDFPFGEKTSVFKVASKMFALSQLRARPLEVSAKCSPEIAADLRATYPAVRAGYHLNKRHWNTITIDGSLPDATIAALIEDSFDLVVDGLPRSEREQLVGSKDR